MLSWSRRKDSKGAVAPPGREAHTMIVEQILNDKGHDVVTLRADHTLQEAAQLLDEKKIGALVTLGLEDRIIGVLSERDIVPQGARTRAAAHGMVLGGGDGRWRSWLVS